jgi:hypothetical protein
VVGDWCGLGIKITLASLVYWYRFERGSWQQYLGTLEIDTSTELELDDQAGGTELGDCYSSCANPNES